MQPVNDVLIEQLKQQGIHFTSKRLLIFNLLAQCKTALSVSLITKQSAVRLDRITVYRTLLYFSKKGIVEVVPNKKGNAKYILSDTIAQKETGEKNKSVYFICNQCQQTEILHAPVNFWLDVLPRYKVSTYSLILEGICTNCK